MSSNVNGACDTATIANSFFMAFNTAKASLGWAKLSWNRIVCFGLRNECQDFVNGKVSFVEAPVIIFDSIRNRNLRAIIADFNGADISF
jgi:hypothetical protein